MRRAGDGPVPSVGWAPCRNQPLGHRDGKRGGLPGGRPPLSARRRRATRAACGSGREAAERAADVPLAEALEGAVAELADPLAGDAEHGADLLERVLAPALEPEVQAEDLGVARREGVERG